MNFLSTIETGSGFWNPIIWIIVSVVALLFVYFIRGFGRGNYKRNTEQIKPFIAGNLEDRMEVLHVKGGNVYWGFTNALKSYYDILCRMHSGDTRDYVIWFLIVMVLLFVIVIVVI